MYLARKSLFSNRPFLKRNLYKIHSVISVGSVTTDTLIFSKFLNGWDRISRVYYKTRSVLYKTRTVLYKTKSVLFNLYS